MAHTLLQYLNSGAAIVVVFGLCLMCHEAGHFLVAKACGMKVEEFAFGFGPALWQRRRGETVYRMNLLFFIGAYVRIAGMEPSAETVERGFHSRPRWQGALVIAAGSLANIVLAVMIFSAVTLWTGKPDPNDLGIYVSKVTRDSPAALAGLHPGDQLIGVDGQRFSLDVAAAAPGSPAARAGLRKGLSVTRLGATEVCTPGELLAALRAAKGTRVPVETINFDAKDIKEQFVDLNLALPAAIKQPLAGPSPEAALNKALGVRFEPLTQSALVGYINARPGKPVTVTISRQGLVQDYTMLTAITNGRKTMRDKDKLYSRIVPIGRIGVVLRSATLPVTAGEAVLRGLDHTKGALLVVPLSIEMMLKRQAEAELAGPLAIMGISAERAQVGWDAVLSWAGIISATLAIMNLLPFAPFDGFKIVLLGFEAIIRRRIPGRLELMVNLVGFFVVILLFVGLTYKDLATYLRYHTF